jgi:thiol-disulfide isomerase/thioredoxin
LKTFILLSVAILISATSRAQDSTAATFKNIQHLPAFKIYAVPDSTIFTSAQLKKSGPLVLMFFSPDCDHCQKETKELMAYKEELKNLQIIMASAAAFKDINAFYKDYNIASMTNIIMGQDANYILGMKYQIRTYPSIFVYDSNGILAKAFVGNISVPAILEAVK